MESINDKWSVRVEISNLEFAEMVTTLVFTRPQSTSEFHMQTWSSPVIILTTAIR